MTEIVGQPKWTTTNYTKGWSSSKEGDVGYMVGLEGSSLLWAPSGKPNNYFQQVLPPLKASLNEKPPASVNRKCIIFHQGNTVQFSSVQSLSHVRLFVTPWTAAHQASLSITNSWSAHKPMFIESVMPSNHLILCRPLLLLPSIPPSIRVFSYESTLLMRWPKYWSFSFSISPSNEHPGTDLL